MSSICMSLLCAIYLLHMQDFLVTWVKSQSFAFFHPDLQSAFRFLFFLQQTSEFRGHACMVTKDLCWWKHSNPSDKLGTLESHNCCSLVQGMLPHMSQQGIFLSAQNVGNVITGEMDPYYDYHKHKGPWNVISNVCFWQLNIPLWILLTVATPDSQTSACLQEVLVLRCTSLRCLRQRQVYFEKISWCSINCNTGPLPCYCLG